MTKKIGVDRFVFLPLHIYRGCQGAFFLELPLRKMCPIPNLLLLGENIIIFSNKTFYLLILEKNLLCLMFGKNLELRKNLQDLRGQNHCKNVGLE